MNALFKNLTKTVEQIYEEPVNDSCQVKQNYKLTESDCGGCKQNHEQIDDEQQDGQDEG